MNGGYLMVSKADTKIYDKLQLGLKVGKPILWYENDTTCYYIDTISGGEITTEIVDDEEVITYGDIILTKGGKTITVSYNGTDATVTEEGEIQIHLYALTFNVSDMYYTIITTKASGINDVIMNTNDIDRTQITLTDEQKTSLYNAFGTALQVGNKYLLNNINGDESYNYGSYSYANEIDFINSGEDGYTLQIRFVNDNITIVLNANNNEIKIFEKQLL